MESPAGRGLADLEGDAALQQFLLLLGSGLTAAGEAVNEVQDHLLAVAEAYGAPEARLVVLPTFVVVSIHPGVPATLEPTQQLRGVLRLDQTSALFEVLKQARHAEIDPRDGSARILDIVAMRPRFGRVVTVLGHMVLTVGICLVLQPTWVDLVVAAMFGVLVGVMKQFGGRWVRVQMVMPVAAAFVVSSLTFVLADQGWYEADLRAMIAPLVSFLPGAALTMAVVELSAGELVTGASRLVSGALQLVLLAFGIVAAAQAFGTPSADALLNTPENLLGWWAPWLGVLVFGIGVFLFNSAPRGSFPWLFTVLVVAFVGQKVGSQFFGPYLGGFFGAFLMTPTAKAIERTPHGPPTLVSFLPAFWLLVPGALGLIGVTEYVSSDAQFGVQDFLGTIGAVLAIAVGVLCGYPLVDSAVGVYRRRPRWRPGAEGDLG